MREKGLTLESDGNGSVLLLVNKSDSEAFKLVEPTMLSAFGHLGIPYKIWDLAAGAPEKKDYLNHSCVILGQDHIGKRLGQTGAEALRDAVADGVGLVGFDGDLGSYCGPLLKIFKISIGNAPVNCSEMKTVNTEHFITGTRELDDNILMDKPVEVWPVESPRYGFTGAGLLQTLNNLPIVIPALFGRGRAVLFACSIKLWTLEIFGHACGLDDVFWKSIVWAAGKPFAIYAMPPFATALVDDCSGAYNHFRYVDTMNKYGWIPHLEIYLEDIDRVMHDEDYADSKKIKTLYDEGLAEFGVHGFTYNNLMWFDHINRKPLSDEQLAENFERYDAYLKKWAIKPSRWENNHFGEMGSNTLPHLKERGIEFLTIPLPFDAAWFDVPGKIAPRKLSGPYYHQGFNRGYLPEDPDFFGMRVMLEAKSRTSTAFKPSVDYLWDNTMFWDESPKTNVEEIIRVATLQVRRGIDNRFCGQTLAHEQRVNMINMEEWEEIWAGVHERLKKYDLIFRPSDYVFDYARSHYDTRIATININRETGRMDCSLKGKAKITTALEVYTNDGGSVKYQLCDVPSFTGTVSVSTMA